MSLINYRGPKALSSVEGLTIHGFLKLKMKKRLLSLAIFFLLGLTLMTGEVFSVFPSSQAANSLSGEQIATEATEQGEPANAAPTLPGASSFGKQRQEALRQQIQEKKEALQQQIQERKETRTQQINQRKKALITRFWHRMTRRISAAIARLGRLVDRISSRLDQIIENNPDFDSAKFKAELVLIEEKIATANDLLTEAEAGFEDIINSEEPRVNFVVSQETIKEVKNLLKESHLDLVQLVNNVKKLS